MIRTEEQVQKEAYMYSTIFEPVKLSVVFNVTHSGVRYI